LSVRDNPLLREQLVDHGLAFVSRFEMDEIARSFVRILDAA
jgi:hypothetical protein